jgi:hypothetical protein
MPVWIDRGPDALDFRMLRLLVVFCLAACGGKQPAPAATGGQTTSVGFAKEGEACHLGERSAHQPGETEKPCAEGLNCCYPCGIAGCDWVCRASACPTGIP